MSRIPQPRTHSKPTPTAKIPVTPTKSGQRGQTRSTTRAPATPTTPRLRTQSSTSRSATPSKPVVVEPPPPVPAISIREAIALKRAEAKKVQPKGPSGVETVDQWDGLEEVILNALKPEEEDLLGRLSIRDTIERARSTGSLNLATRALLCLPSALFEIHLNVTPEPLKSVPNEPALPPSESVGRKGRNLEKTTWFEAQDLTVLKAWNNEIQEIQHEISLFGSLKTVDLHKNKLTYLPNSFADLTALTVLDLSHNALNTVPDNLFALPELTTLNLSHNQLSSLPFNGPFKDASRSRVNQLSGGSFFAPVVARSTTPLPRLVNLDASHNAIAAQAIHDNIPVSLVKVDLSSNPLGQSQRLLQNLASLNRLKELRLAHAEVGADSFPSSLFRSRPFPCLRLLDMGETQVHPDVIKEALKSMHQELDFDFVNDDPPEGVTRVLVGKRIIKEVWEIELERRSKTRVDTTVEFTDVWSEHQPQKRSNSRAETVSPTPSSTTKTQVAKSIVKPKDVQKELWEIEAEQGLATEGGRRRARAAAATSESQPSQNTGVTPPSVTPSPSVGLNNPQYYSAATQTLRLPASVPPQKVGHNRAFSVAATSPSSNATSRTEDFAIPTPTLPLSSIAAQPFADTLKVLILSSRRMDKSFALPSPLDSCGGFLPCLEELQIEGCNLSDLVPTTVLSSDLTSGANSPQRSNEFLIPTIAKLFPNLKTLNLSYNAITNTSLTPDALSSLILASPRRNGLRHLRLRGNKISDLEGFLKLAESFKRNRDVPSWKMEELDLRDNEIGKLPPELGLLPLDILLVDGNTFRVPQRRVWEREGTKGLLSWLRGRIE